MASVSLVQYDHHHVFPPQVSSTALINACKNGKQKIVELLLSRGANPNLQNKVIPDIAAVWWSAIIVTSQTIYACSHFSGAYR